MINLLKRIFLFLVGVPVLVGAILLFPRYHSPLWVGIIIILSALGTVEAGTIFLGPGGKARNLLFFCIGLVLPAAAAMELYGITGDILLPLFLSLTALSFLPAILSQKAADIAEKTGSQLAVLNLLVYPGLFMTFLVRMAGLEAAQLRILLFLVIIFSNDTFAYIVGSLFGRFTRHPFPVSPNKSIAGFIGGFVGALALGLIFIRVFPSALAEAALTLRASLILLIALSANVGDLIESALKRRAGIKDSGKLMPGRGGVLDSTDSVFFSAPFYYYLLLLFF